MILWVMNDKIIIVRYYDQTMSQTMFFLFVFYASSYHKVNRPTKSEVFNNNSMKMYFVNSWNRNCRKILLKNNLQITWMFK